MISDTELLQYVKPSTDDELETLRRLEKAAIAAVQNRTGRYFGAEGEVVEILHWRGWPMQLSNVPTTLTSVESWDGSAWSDVDASTYYLDGAFIYWQNTLTSNLARPTRYRVTYDAGYEDSDTDAWDAPDDIKQAVILHVTYYYDQRDGEGYDAFKRSFDSLIDPYVKVAV